MGEILGVGLTHAPPLSLADGGAARAFERLLAAPNVDHRWRDRAGWPPAMIAEWGDDDGAAACAAHRQRLIDAFAALRKVIDDFAPDFVVIVGDDQYENFREDIIPPFCILGLDDDWVSRPWADGPYAGRQNAWDEGPDWELRIHGHREGAKLLTTGFIERGLAMPYAYRTLHQSVLAIAFTHTLLYLDFERRGFPHPVIPFHVNCYGSDVLTSEGGTAHLFKTLMRTGAPDPPGPSPAMCFAAGWTMAEIIGESTHRAVLIGSASWSHSFLSSATGYVVPHHASDRVFLEEMLRGDFARWGEYTHEELQRTGHHEMLNWIVLAGAMTRLQQRAVLVDYVETFLFQADKCFAYFPPSSDGYKAARRGASGVVAQT
jgi:hypothetical protein